jgi:uracil-DNA glycosylase family 4
MEPIAVAGRSQAIMRASCYTRRCTLLVSPRSADDGLTLSNCRITNAVKCLPPDNKPIGAEINTCNAFLANELRRLPERSVVLALGGIAHRAIVKAVGERQAAFKFAHAAVHNIGRLRIVDSYHCSRYNTNTGRLTTAMFTDVFALARELLDDSKK